MSHLVAEVLSGPNRGQRFELSLPCQIGRAAKCELHLDEAHIDAVHGVFEQTGETLTFTDHGTLNGTLHRREGRITPLGGKIRQAELWPDDILELGDPLAPVQLRIIIEARQVDGVIARREPGRGQSLSTAADEQSPTLKVFYRHSQALNSARDRASLLRAGAKLCFELVSRATHVSFALAADGGRFPTALVIDRHGQNLESPVSTTLVREVVQSRSGLLIVNAQEEFANAASIQANKMASAVCVPLEVNDEVRGVLVVDNRAKSGLFGGEALDAISMAGSQIAIALESVNLQEKLLASQQQLEGQNAYLKASQSTGTPSGLVGESKAMSEVTEGISKVKDTRVPVLILGETGTGKELVARAIHAMSNRAEHLFVTQNCSALSDALLESELFGHVKGAFTGADRDKKGLFVIADGGTIFLDELGEMPLKLQAKLLRVLQEGEVRPVGALQPTKVDVRVVSATHRDLDAMVEEKTFRQDLYYRLHVYPIHMPPLRQRRDDIPLLADFFLQRYRSEFGSTAHTFDPQALAALRAYDWPGNVRELQNEIQRMLIHGVGDIVTAQDISSRILGRAQSQGALPSGGSLKEMMELIERRLLAKALDDHDNNKTRTAKALGITREGLHKKLARYGMA